MFHEQLSPFHPEYLNLLDILPDAILFCDAAGVIVACNAHTERLLGYSRAELVGQPVEVLVPEEKRRAHVGHRRMFTANPAARQMNEDQEFFAVRKDGGRLPVSIALNTLDHGNQQLVIVSIRDTVALTRARENERQALERSTQAQRLESLGLMSCGIAHDINNLLSVIHGYADLALCNLLDTGQTRESLFAIDSSARRLGQLTDQIITFAGGKPVNKVPIDVPELVRETLDLLRVSIPDTITLHFRAEANLPLLHADPGKVGQVLMNLLLNASDAIGDKPGEIRVHCGLARHFGTGPGNTGGCYLTLRVDDTGKGLGAADMHRILEPFYTTKSGGKGLGLSIVHGMLKAHDGFLNVSSEPGKGCSFTVFLPIDKNACSGMSKAD